MVKDLLQPLMPLEPILAELRAMNLLLGVATNDSHVSARNHMTHVGIIEHFEDIKDSHALKEKQTIVADACRELSVHMTLEEEVFYPAVRGALDDEDLMNEALVEHEGATALIHDLESYIGGAAAGVRSLT